MFFCVWLDGCGSFARAVTCIIVENVAGNWFSNDVGVLSFGFCCFFWASLCALSIGFVALCATRRVFALRPTLVLSALSPGSAIVPFIFLFRDPGGDWTICPAFIGWRSYYLLWSRWLGVFA